MEAFPHILTSGETNPEKISKLQSIDGIGKENAHTFVENIPHCITFFTACGLQERLLPTETTTAPMEVSPYEEHELYGEKVVFTGFRDKALMETLERQYKVSFGSSVSKQTFMVVVKTMDEDNAKVKQARKHEIPMMAFADFKAKYGFV